MLVCDDCSSVADGRVCALVMFGSDNQAPAHNNVIQAIVDANAGRSGSYGYDVWSERALAAIKQVFETDDLDMYLVGTGGAANGLALSLLCPPWGAVLAHGQAHVVADEGGGPEHFTSGARMIGIGGDMPRLTPQSLQAAAQQFARTNIQSPQPRAVTISNLSENGLAYTPAQILALSAVCQQEGWKLHMDGARFANAIVSTGATPAQLTWASGVDALSFGFTKNGAVCAEALIVFGTARTDAAPYLRKRSGHLFSKQRYMSAQIVAMLQGDLWRDLALAANSFASRLGQVFAKHNCDLVFPVDGNEVFVRLSDQQAAALRACGIGFYPWAPAGHGAYRFVTCWQTTEEDVERVENALVS
jgi:threonine aldolase